MESFGVNARYPKRLRIQPLKYWMGERYLYRNGKIVDILKVDKK